MRLKKLEIKGFKSFANDTVIHFNENVIGIVGPNGSGKSNIVDAIRWVLGEQKSKELRLDNMTSVIFNGTKKRKPSSVAQVSVTFDNTKNLLPTEYQSVTITRMLYRSGESEYRLNGVTCRLKDITGLFLDTGIGSNSYAIIALGMVDDILADKDNSRRKMFEQAAGVSKYKVRKRETINKLNSTTEDLNRIEDLLFEIVGNLETLEKQAKRAKRYFKIKEEYKDLSIALAVNKIRRYKDKQATIVQQLQSEQDRYRTCDTQITRLEAQLERAKTTILDEEKALSQQQRDLNRLVGSIRGRENDKKMLIQKLQFVDQNKGKLAAAIEQAKEKMTALEEDIDFYRSNLNYEKHLEEQHEDELDKAQQELNRIKSEHENLKTDLDAIVGDQRTIEQTLFELEKKKAINKNQLESLQQTVDKGSEDIKSRTGEVDSLRTKAAAFQQQVDEVTTALAALEKLELERNQKLDQLTKDKEKVQFELNRTNRELDAKKNEYKLTKSMVESLEGFPESIRYLKKQKDWDDSPLLTDLVYVKDEFRVAIEHFLEPYLNHYVVQDMETAWKAINMLAEAQKGKAQFFVMDAIDAVDARDEPPHKGDALPAISLIETDPIYQPLFQMLLNGVWVAPPEEVASAATVSGITWLASDGSIVKNSHRIAGGSVGLFEGNKIGRKKTLEVLQQTIKDIEQETKHLKTSFQQLETSIQEEKAKTFPKSIAEKQQELNKINQERVSVDTRLENFEQFIQEVESRQSEAREKITALNEQNLQIEKDLTEKEQAVLLAKSKIADTDTAYRDVAEKMSKASATFNEKNIAFIKQQNKVTGIQNDLSYREKELTSLKDQQQKNQQTLDQSDGEMTDLQRQIADLEAGLTTDYEKRKSFEGTLSDVEQKYFESRGKVNEIEDELRQQQKIKTEAQVLVNNLKEKSNDIKFDITSMAQRLRIEFEEDINVHINQLKVEFKESEEEVQLRVEKLKNRLDNYGEINPMAVQAYDEMKLRHDSITQQRDDILEAKQTLLDTIKEIEETATKQFLDSFDKARLYFINVFRSLFTADDSCDLILLSPETPLESKIEIVAKPKGKRPQSISQLSGGEKTLTATALLFALYLLKPAPFCIFDEVDAPLDDANITKFNNIIKEFSKESQFIIVTHNKLTMAAVDTIYGVYMGEQGVSAVSPVDFRHFELTGTFEAVS